MGIISFYIDDLHYNLAVKLLNDRWGIQVRGGCSCAGTYGHYLLNVGAETSRNICDAIDFGDHSAKPGWVRLSLHPTMANEELETILGAVADLACNHAVYASDYQCADGSNEFQHKTWSGPAVDLLAGFAT
jgi:selenocysteine lyase/cysteine desulfurase